MRAIKSLLSKVKFVLNRNPIIEKRKEWRRFIPKPYSAVVTITADFELAWAWRYSKNNKEAKNNAVKLAKMERQNIPLILNYCENYEIPITWTTVGHLFLKECVKTNLFPHPEVPRQQKYENKYWKFNGSDWFEYDPCSNYNDAPEWYAPDLIDMILKSKIKHEIGCHTFSHIDCRDEVCPPDVFEAEINECLKEAAKVDLKLKSFVHPGHTIGNLDKLAELGFTSFQTDPGNILGYPFKHKNGLWVLKRTYEFAWREGWSVDYHIYRYKTIIDRAIENCSICNFWFHPSFDPKFLDKIIPPIFHYLNSRNKEIWETTVGEYIDWLNSEKK